MTARADDNYTLIFILNKERSLKRKYFPQDMR